MDARLILAKRRLIARVFELRRNDFTYASLDQPQSVQDDVIQTDSGPQKRRRIILTAHGCSVATCSMCPLPDEAVDGKTPVTLDHWLAQLNAALTHTLDLHTVTLYHNGNWFSDREVPEHWRTSIYRFLRVIGIKELVVESLPQFITEERLAHARKWLGPIKLVVAIGLQSSNQIVREVCMTSTCAGDTFAHAVGLLRAQGDDAQAFLLFHPPFLSMAESIWDIRESIRVVAAAGLIPTICPMKVAPNTVVADLAARGLYPIPSAWQDPWPLLEAIWDLPERSRVAASLLDPSHPLSEAFAWLNQGKRLSDYRSKTGIWVPPIQRVPIQPNPLTILNRIETYLNTIPSKPASNP